MTRSALARSQPLLTTTTDDVQVTKGLIGVVLRPFIEQLPPRYREVITLSELDGLSARRDLGAPFLVRVRREIARPARTRTAQGDARTLLRVCARRARRPGQLRSQA